MYSPYPPSPAPLNVMLSPAYTSVSLIVDLLTNTSIFLMSSAVVCVVTEGISFYENLGELGVKIPYGL